MSVSNKEVVAFLKNLYDEYGGILHPRDVVEAARPKSSPIHSKFEWSDNKAAEQWRISQAQELLRIVVEYSPSKKGKKIPVRVFYSLTPDRKKGGGYRTAVDIYSDRELTAILLRDASEEMKSFQDKYRQVRELKPVILEMKKVSRMIDGKWKKTA